MHKELLKENLNVKKTNNTKKWPIDLNREFSDGKMNWTFFQVSNIINHQENHKLKLLLNPTSPSAGNHWETKCQQMLSGLCGETGALIHYWWRYKLMSLMEISVEASHKARKRSTKWPKDTCSLIFIGVYLQ